MFDGIKLKKRKKERNTQNTEYALIEAASLPFICNISFQKSEERISDFIYVLLQASSVSTP
jgi:hypothetical protein